MCKQPLKDVDHTQEIKDNQVILKENLSASTTIVNKLESSENIMDEHESIKTNWENYEKNSLKKIKAELDIKDNLWFFDCHFKEDPVMPGCLGLDAMWQLVGFYLGWIGNPGKGRALGVLLTQ